VNSNIKTLLFWVILVCLALLLFMVVRSGQGRRETALNFTDFMNKVNEQQVKDVTISGSGSTVNTGIPTPASAPRFRFSTTSCTTR